MGYSYDRGGLCCDKCGKSGGVRKRACKYTVTDASETRGGPRRKLHYCQPPALCPPCFAEIGRTVHGAACRDGAAWMQAREDMKQAALDAGDMLVCSAWGDWADGVPAGMVRVAFRGWDGETERIMPAGEYDPAGKPRLSDYPDAAPVYADGQVIEYMSWDRSGYSVGQVVRYADAAEQDNPADQLVIIRSRSGGKPFPVRQSQLRVKHEREAVR